MEFNFTSNYDENLMENLFFQTLRNEYKELFLKAVSENCVICVPRKDSFPRCLLTLETFFSHILIRTDELPESHFLNLCEAKVKIVNKIITIDREVGRQSCTHILFQETFYTEDGLKYEVLCLEQPLEENSLSTTRNNNLVVLKNLRDCIDFLWGESGTYEPIETIDKEIYEFLKKYDSINNTIFLQNIRNAVDILYNKCIEILLQNSNIRKKYKVQKHNISNLETAVQTYIQHGVYKKVMKNIKACTALEDAKLNKIIRNLSDLHFQDFNSDSKFYSNIPKARLELSKISCYSTFLGKVGCLKRTVNALSDSCKCKKVLLDADELLQILSFVIIKTNLSDWNAQLKYLKLFQFSSLLNFDESSYLCTTLEAALTYIQQKIFFEEDEKNFQINSKKNLKTDKIQSLMDITHLVGTKKEPMETVEYFFKDIAQGNMEKVKQFIERNHKDTLNHSISDLCHPLCNCEKCSSLMLKDACEKVPNIKSCNDQGLTALHIACLYNVPSIVDYLISKGADLNVSDYDGKTPTHYAALRGDQNALLLLLHNNANFNALDNASNSPLHLCSNNGHENCVKALVYFSEHLGVKLEINQQNIKGDTPLHNAAKWGYQNIVEILLESGSDPFITNRKKFSPIDVAHNEKVLQLLKQKYNIAKHYIMIKPLSQLLDLEEQTKSDNQIVKSFSPNSTEKMKKAEKILRAVESGDINLVCFLLGIEMNDCETLSEDEKLITNPQNKEVKCHPLCTCAKCNVLSEISEKSDKILKQKFININICNSEGYTSLHVACRQGNLDMVRCLIKNGALLNVQTTLKLWTPLMLACKNQKFQVVKELLKSGCDLDMQDYELNTALHFACKTNNIKLVEILLNYGPNLQIKNIDNKTALQEAKEKLNFGIVNVLKTPMLHDKKVKL